MVQPDILPTEKENLNTDSEALIVCMNGTLDIESLWILNLMLPQLK